MRHLIGNRGTRTLLLAVALALPLTAGCKPKHYRVVTRITPQGSVYREIFQPVDESLPPEALKGGKKLPVSQPAPGPQPTTSSQPAAYEIAPAWKKLWQTFEPASQPKDAWEGKYIKASGEFANADAVPVTYHLPAEAVDGRVSTNQITHGFQDNVLFGIDSWEETITETIRLDEYVEALDELIADMLPAIEATFEELLGAEYDLSAFHQFLRREGATAYRRYALASYQHSADRRVRSNVEGEIAQHLKEILAGVGFDLPLGEGGIETDGMGERLTEYLADLLREKVRLKPSGRRLTAEQAKELAQRVNGYFSSNESDTQPADVQDEGRADKKAEFSETYDRQIKRLYGEDYEQRTRPLQARICGAHGHGSIPFVALFEQGRQFVFTFEAPGPILETNGERTGIRSVRWNFTDSDFFPNGYTMRVRAIRPNPEAEKRVFGKVVLDDLDRVCPLIEQIPTEGPVREALEEAVKQASLEPLKALLESPDAATVKAARAILDLADAP